MNLPENDRLADLNAQIEGIRAVAVCDEVDTQLLPVFLEEADDLLPKIAHCLHGLHDGSDLHLIRRLLHTFKGSARMTGIMSIGHLAHRMEGHLLDNPSCSAAALAEDLAQINALRETLRHAHFVEKSDATDAADMICERLYRTMRQTAKELNKRVNLELTGFDADIPKRMGPPLEHLLRNAIVHGIEDEQQRVSRGKEAIGEITISVRREGAELVFEFSDDGRGLDIDALRAEAVKRGLPLSSDEQLSQLIFTPGFSTVDEMTQLAGRGIGMDAVYSEVASLGGRIDVSSSAGLGTKFTLSIPSAQSDR